MTCVTCQTAQIHESLSMHCWECFNKRFEGEYMELIKGTFYINEPDSNGEYLSNEADFIIKNGQTYNLQHGKSYELPQLLIDFINNSHYSQPKKNKNFGDPITFQYFQRYNFVTEKEKGE